MGAENVVSSRSLAVAARAQTSPSIAAPAFDLSPGTLDYGVGIHGERGTRTIDHRPVEELVRQMTDDLVEALPAGQDKMLVVVNGLGATTSLELHGIGSILHDLLTARGGAAALAEAFLNDVGGASGPLSGLLFQHLATVSWFEDQAPEAPAVADAARSSLAAMHRVDGAKVGDCTLVDALARSGRRCLGHRRPQCRL